MIRQLKRLVDGSRVYWHFGGVEESIVGIIRILLHRPNLRLRQVRWRRFKRRNDPLEAALDGIRLTLNPDDGGISAELALEGQHEPHATALLMDQLGPGMTVLDVGANLGYYAIQEANRVGPTGKVIAIEPAPSTFALLEKNVALNRCENVVLLQGAVSDKAGEAELHVGAHANVSRLAERPDYIDKVTVPTYRIDDLIRDERRVDVIRMDIEGHEVRALEGMLETLREKKPLFCLEFHFSMLEEDDIRAFFERMQEIDYEVGCFVFRFSDEMNLGHTLGRRRTVYKRASGNELVDRMRSENAVIFLQVTGRRLRGLDRFAD